MPKLGSADGPSVFLSYTGASTDVARKLLERLRRWGIDDVFDYTARPLTSGVLGDELEQRIDAADVFVALVCEHFPTSICLSEINRFLGNKIPEGRRCIVLFLSGKGVEWWEREGLKERAGDLVQNILFDSVSQQPKAAFLDDNGIAILSPIYKRTFDWVAEDIKTWWRARPAESVAEPAARRDVLVLLGGLDGALDAECAARRNALVELLETHRADGQVIDLGDDWGSIKRRAHNRSVLTGHGNATRHALIVAPAPFIDEEEPQFEAEVLSEVDQTLGPRSVEGSPPARRMVWLPSDAVPTTADPGGEHFDYLAGEPATMADLVRQVLGLSSEARLLIHHTGNVTSVCDWLTTDFAGVISVDGELSIGTRQFIDPQTLEAVLAQVTEDGTERPIVVTYTDKDIRYSGRRYEDIVTSLHNQVYEIENVLEKWFRPGDERRVFRVFVQFKWSDYISGDFQVNQRRWPILRITEKQPVNTCPASRQIIREQFASWMNDNWRAAGAAHSATA